MKSLFISDIHLSLSINEYVQEKQVELTEFIVNYCKKNKIENVFFVGDIFRKNDLNRMDLKTINFINDFIGKIKTCVKNVFAISGNHDQLSDSYYSENQIDLNTGESAIELLKGIILIDNKQKSFENIGIHGVPFYRQAECFYKALQYKINNPEYDFSDLHHKHKILVIHQTPRDSGYPSDDMIDFEHPIFQRFTYVICGHIHKPLLKRIGNTTFVQTGSCMAYKRNEVGTKFIYQHDSTLQTQCMEAIKIPIKIEYMKINVDDKEAKQNITQTIANFDLKNAIETIAKGEHQDRLQSGLDYYNKLFNKK